MAQSSKKAQILLQQLEQEVNQMERAIADCLQLPFSKCGTEISRDCINTLQAAFLSSRARIAELRRELKEDSS